MITLFELVFQNTLNRVLLEIEEEHRVLDEAGSRASEEAKKLGLVSKGWGRWADPQSGQIVAKTIQGHLVKVDPEKSHLHRSDHEREFHNSTAASNAFDRGITKPDKRYAELDPELGKQSDIDKANSRDFRRYNYTEPAIKSGMDGIRQSRDSKRSAASPEDIEKYGTGNTEPDAVADAPNLQADREKRLSAVSKKLFKDKTGKNRVEPNHDLTHGEVPLSGPLPDKPGVSKQDMKRARKYDRKQIGRLAKPIDIDPGSDVETDDIKVVRKLMDKHGPEKVYYAFNKLGSKLMNKQINRRPLTNHDKMIEKYVKAANVLASYNHQTSSNSKLGKDDPSNPHKYANAKSAASDRKDQEERRSRRN